MNDSIARVAIGVSQVIKHISFMFVPSAKITVLVRIPGEPDQDFCMTDDEMSEVAQMVERRRKSEEEGI